MNKPRILGVVALLVGLCLAPLATGGELADARFQASGELVLNAWPKYLGPEVVISGSVSAATEPPDVTVVVTSLDDPAAADVFNGPANLALRPPRGLPSASWRVPLTLAPGQYSVTATSTIDGAPVSQSQDFDVISSEPVPLIELIPADAFWSYYDAGDQPAADPASPTTQWYMPGYDAGAWFTGPAELGYGDGNEATVTAATGIFGQAIVTQYFRHEFSVGDITDVDAFELSVLRDDGAIVYLNGVELGRTNMRAGAVNYGTSASSVSEAVVTFEVPVELLLPGTNLLAVEVHQSSATSTDISFAAQLEEVRLDEGEARVSNNTPGTFVLAAGDIARCGFGGDEAVAEQMGDLFDTDIGLFIGLGDMVYESGTINEFNNCYGPSVGQFLDVTWPSPGNHEHYTSPNAAGYRQYFGAAAGPLAGPNGGLWYSFDIDDYWHVIALDSDCKGREVLPGAINGDGCAVGSEQEAWLRADLEANQDKNILAFFHHPPYTNNRYQDHTYTWPLWRALTEYGVELTLHGHEHHYERYQPLDYWGDLAANGTREFIIGSGGTYPRYQERSQAPESAFRGTFPYNTYDFGVLQLWLQPDGYEWKWESIEGLAPVDSGTSGLTPAMDRPQLYGTVIDQNTNTGLAGIEICFTATRIFLETCTTSDDQGNYDLGPMVPDVYDFSATDGNRDYLLRSIPQFTHSAPGTGEPFDIEMVPSPSITGTVTDEFSGLPINGANVCAATSSLPITCTTTGTNGTYEFARLDPRGYRISFTAPGYFDECYDSELGPCDGGSSVVSLQFDDVTGVDATMLEIPSMFGTVTEQATGDPVAGVNVCALASGFSPRCELTANDGGFEIAGIEPDVEYEVVFTAQGFLAECFDGVFVPCGNGSTLVSVPFGDVTGVDAALTGYPSMSGTLTEQSTGDPIVGAQVCASTGAQSAECVDTQDDGGYEIPGLDPGSDYDVVFSAPGFLSECFDGVEAPCGDDVTQVSVLFSDVTGIDASLLPGLGGITGQVTHAQTQAPLSGIDVCADSFILAEPICVVSASDGTFAVNDLRTGNYIVSYQDPTGRYETECYRNRTCDRPLPVGVVQPDIRDNIDGSLEPVPVTMGDADCSGTLSVADALVIAQFAVGNREEAPCPRTDPATQIAVGSADVNGDGFSNIGDALLVAQCSVGIPNVLCP